MKVLLALGLVFPFLLMALGGCDSSPAPSLGVPGQPTLVYVYTDN